jgi:iron only hydrogenase large subunit-like protein
MDCLKPIYSERTQCQDCYKCVRQCPVKAITVQDGCATVNSEMCIVCGHCVEVCPAGAKRVRDDLRRARLLLKRKEKVFVSLAPSFVSEFHDLEPGQLTAAIRQLGFEGVSETALGAEEVSATLGIVLDESENRIFLSSACPTAVEYIQKYHPELSEIITPVLSPLLSHCKLLRKTYSEDIGVVFVGPCIAKKLEADAHPDLCDVAITFEALRRWLMEDKIEPASLPTKAEAGFVPFAAKEGAMYPVEGGMNDTVKANCRTENTVFVTVSGVANMARALRDLERTGSGKNIFLELLACEGGCINGPKSQRRNMVASRLDVLDYTRLTGVGFPRTPTVEIAETFLREASVETAPSQEAIAGALRRIGKVRADDELNCGGCGYDTCRQLARALLEDKAEEGMCVSYMRQLAQKKANALLRTIPFGVIILNEKLRVIDCNEKFAQLFGDDLASVYEAVPGLEGASLNEILPIEDMFKEVLKTGQDIVNRTVRVNNRMFNVTIFSIDDHRVVGATFLDVTRTEMRREQVVEKAQQVIQNTLSTVQDIAFRLGRNAAESEVILNSIIEAYHPQAEDQEERK